MTEDGETRSQVLQETGELVPGPRLSNPDLSPLVDVRVLDLSQLLPGPFCAQILADLGAEVIKVEPPGGDPAREMPSDIFATANRNKASVDLDLKAPLDREACLRLAADTDVVVEGFRPGVVERLGVGYEDVCARNPAVIYCSISGFGRTGSRRDRPGHDANYLATSGALAYSGHWSEGPRRSGLPVADLAASCYGAIAILAALRERARTGVGCHIDLAMADAAMAFASVRGGRRLDLTDDGRAHLYPTNDLFSTADGAVLAVGAVEDRFWEQLRKVVSQAEPELLDVRFDTEPSRRRHGDELKELLDRAFAQRTATEWLAALEEYDVPVELVESLETAATSPDARERGIVAHVDGEVHVLFPALRNGEPMGRFRRVAPALGEDRELLLGLAGGQTP